MGTYLIPGETSTIAAAQHVDASFTPGREWILTVEGVLFNDPILDDLACAALYAGYVPSGETDETRRWPLPSAIAAHTKHLRDYLAKDPALITNAESVHVIKDLIRAAFLANARLEAE